MGVIFLVWAGREKEEKKKRKRGKKKRGKKKREKKSFNLLKIFPWITIYFILTTYSIKGPRKWPRKSPILGYITFGWVQKNGNDLLFNNLQFQSNRFRNG